MEYLRRKEKRKREIIETNTVKQIEANISTID